MTFSKDTSLHRHSGDSKLYLYLIAILINVPKINLFSLGSFDQGIRVEDFIVVFFALKVFFSQNFYRAMPRKVFLIWAYIGFSSLLAVLFFEGNDSLRIMYFFRVTEYCLFAAALYSLKSSVKLSELLKLTLLIQFLAILFDFSQGSFRPSGTFAGPWELTTVLGLMCFACTVIYPNEGVKKYNYLLVLVLANFLTLSRTGLLAVLVAFASSYRSFLISMTIFVSLSVTVVAYVDLSSVPWLQVVFRPGNLDLVVALIEGALNGTRPEILTSYNNADFTQNASPSLAVRFSIWLNLIELWASIDYLALKLIFGIGLGSISVVVDGFYIRLFFELGLMGTVLYLSIIIRMLLNPDLRVLAVYISIICLTLDPYSSSKIAYCIGVIYVCWVRHERARRAL